MIRHAVLGEPAFQTLLLGTASCQSPSPPQLCHTEIQLFTQPWQQEPGEQTLPFKESQLMWNIEPEQGEEKQLQAV